MDKGIIILLNGPSSSGKTIIAHSLQKIMEGLYLTIGLDKFYKLYSDAFPKHFNPPPIPRDVSVDEGYELRDKCTIRSKQSLTFHHFLASFSIAGNNIIADTVIETKMVLEQLLNTLIDFPVFLVGVHCPLEELERREKERGDRYLGLAKKQFDRVHAYMIYDLELDTDSLSPLECAQKIKETILALPKEFSFNTLKKVKDKLYQS